MLFMIDHGKNSMSEIKASTFSELQYGERKHLQEWIAKNPACLCSKETDKLLVIQKEFDGFEGTGKRLDLLAVDQDGALVVIENKLNDTGTDVVWQVMQYVSFCSTLKQQQIIDIYQKYLDKFFIDESAIKNLETFFDGNSLDEVSLNSEDQRMILVAAEFRPEVTSTVMWMLAHNLRIQCYKANPYRLPDESVLLDIEQIIPVKEAEDYIIKMAEKDREKDEEQATLKGLQKDRQLFWRSLLDQYNLNDPSFSNVSPSKDHWLSCGAGVSYCVFSFLATKTMAGIELTISLPEKASNERIFDSLMNRKSELEAVFGGELYWDRQDENKRCRIAKEKQGVNVANQNDWDEMMTFMCGAMPRFIKALKQPLYEAFHNKSE